MFFYPIKIILKISVRENIKDLNLLWNPRVLRIAIGARRANCYNRRTDKVICRGCLAHNTITTFPSRVNKIFKGPLVALKLEILQCTGCHTFLVVWSVHLSYNSWSGKDYAACLYIQGKKSFHNFFTRFVLKLHRALREKKSVVIAVLSGCYN